MNIRDFTPRLYQETIFNTAVNKNTLVILSTGLGKTYISLLLAVHRLTNFPGSKVLLLAPTRPLVMQHLETFKKHIDINENKLVLFTGAINPEKRKELWREASVIFSTPQGLANDITNNRINLEEVSCLILDEVHHAVGNYDYCFICNEYNKKARYPRILGLTASPGSDLAKIEEVCKNTFIEDIEIRTEDDSDVRPYLQEREIEYMLIELPQSFKDVKNLLNECLKTKLKKLKDIGVRSSSSKTDLLQLQKELHERLARGEKDFTLWHAVSYLAEVMKVYHALELFETQGTNAAYRYTTEIYEGAEKNKTKAVKNLIKDINFKSAFLKIKNLVENNLEHPKLNELKKIVQKEVNKNPKIKIIVFNHYRDSASKLVNELNGMENVNAQLFIGQTKKGGLGLSQKEQINILKDFKENKFNVLVGTSVTEEGLDIFAVDLVIFYEPIPSAIRTIQRKGRTGRTEKGRIIVLVTKNTRDEVYRWTAHHKEKRMLRAIKELKGKLKLKQQPPLTSFLEKEQLKIIADYREKGSAVIKELINLGIKVEMQNLTMGDYLVSKRVVCEFKQQEDFLKSIIDGRLTKQVKQLKDNYQRPLVVIQGQEDLYSLRNIHPNSIRGMLAAITVSYGIPIMFTKNPQDTAGLLIAIAKREQQSTLKDFGVMHERKPLTTKEKQEFVIESLPGIGPSLAKSLLKKFRTVKNIVNAEENSLREIEKIGTKKANEIKRIVEEHYEDS